MFAFIKKQFLIEISYRFNFIFQFLSLPITFLSFFFLSKIIDNRIFFEDTTYLSFAIIGIASLEFFVAITNFAAQKTREEQISGVLEEISVTKSSFIWYFFNLCIYPAIISIIKFMIYIIILFYFDYIDLSFEVILLTIPIFIISIFAISGISMITASLILIIKRGNFINSLFITISGFCGGIVYPVDVIPEKLHFISNILPTYHLPAYLRNAFSNDFNIETAYYHLTSQIYIAIIILTVAIILNISTIKLIKKYSSISNF